MEFSPNMLAAVARSKAAVRQTVEPEQEREPQKPLPPDTKPIIFVQLHGTKYVRGGKIVTPAMVPPGKLAGRSIWEHIDAKVAAFRSFAVRLRSFAGAMFGGFVGRKEYNGRQAVCGLCPKRIATPVACNSGVVVKSYCGPCGCPKWIMSRLDVKNWFAKWKCPKRSHAGPYPDDAVRDWLTENEHATEEQLKADGGSCGGCGGR